MKLNAKVAALIILTSIGLTAAPVSSYAEHPHPPEGTADSTHTMETTHTTEEESSNGGGAAKGCAAGAAIGTAIAPGVGTLAGCVVAGIWGWFW